MNKRVVITGVGMITPIGSGRDTFWNALIAGVSGVDDVTCIDTSGYKVHKGCEVKNFNYSDYIKNGALKKIGKGYKDPPEKLIAKMRDKYNAKIFIK